MADTAYEPDYQSLMRRSFVARLLGTNAKRLIDAFATVFQSYEDLVFDVYVSTPLSVASGGELDLWGRSVRERRTSLTDDQYRKVIQLKLLSANARGNLSDFYALLVAISNDDSAVIVARDGGNNTVRLELVQTQPVASYLVDRLPTLLDITKQPGVEVQTLISEAGDDTFRFDIGPGFDEGLLAELIV